MLKNVRRAISFVMVVCMLCASSTIMAQNLVENPSFEYKTREDLVISSPILKVNDEDFSVPAPDMTVNISVKVKKLSQGEESVTLCSGLFDSENELKKVDFTTSKLTGGGVENLVSFNFELGSAVEDTDYIKVFVWSDFRSMYPFVKTYNSKFSVSDNIAGDLSSWTISDNNVWRYATSDEYVSSITHASYNRTYGYNALANYGYQGVGENVYQDITVKPNTTYLVHFGVLSGKAGLLKFEVLNSSGVEIASIDSVNCGTTFFRTNKLVFNSGDNTSLRIQFVDNSNDTYVSYIGDVTVTENLAIYGNFEDAADNYYPGKYMFENISESAAAADYTYDEAYDGYSCIKLDGGSVRYSAGEEIKAAGAGRYVVSCAVKYNSDVASGQTSAPQPVLRAKYYDSNTSATSYSLSALGNGWSRMAVFVDLTEELAQSGFFDVSFYVARQNGSVYIDDVSIIKTDASNIIYNGDFESGVSSPWKDAYSSTKVTLSADKEFVHSGDYSLKVVQSAAGHPVTQHDITKKIQSLGDGTYRLSGWMKYPELSSGQWAMVKLFTKMNGASTFTTVLSLNQNNTSINENGFHYFEKEFTTNSGNISSVADWSETYVSAYVANGAASTFYIDDFKLEKIVVAAE